MYSIMLTGALESALHLNNIGDPIIALKHTPIHVFRMTPLTRHITGIIK